MQAGYVPDEIKGWNWGAFQCSLLWAAAMNRWGWFAVCFIPYCGAWIAAIYLGIKGNELAWQSRQWRNIEHFKETQAVWNSWGKALFAISIVVFILYVIVAASNSGGY